MMKELNFSNNVKKNKKLNLLEILLYFFCFMPFVTPIKLPFGSDMQPYALLVAVILVVLYFRNGKILLKPYLKVLLLTFFLATILFLVAIIRNLSLMILIRSYYNYFSILFVTTAVYECFKHKGFDEKTVKVLITSWLIVGIIQLFLYRNFLSVIVSGFRTSDNRGVCSLASEPSFYGYMCFFWFMIASKFQTQKKLFYAIILFQLLCLSQSAVGILYFIILLALYLLHTVVIKNPLKSIVVLIAIIMTLIFVYKGLIALFPNQRYVHLLQMIINNPDYIMLDESINARYNAIVEPITSFLANYGVPHGLGSRYMSGYGVLIYELGIFAIPYMIYIYNVLKKGYGVIYGIAVSIIMFSAVQIGLPTLSFVIAVGLYSFDCQ